MPEQTFSLADKVKTLREKKGWSAADLAQKAGLSPTTLTGIEEGAVSPPLGQVASLAQAFQVSLGDLFGDSGDSPFCIVRSDDRKTVSRFDSDGGTSGGYSYQSLGYKKQNRHMEPFLVHLAPAETFKPEPNQHSGEEILFVLEGEVEISLSGHADLLKQGDSIYYDSSLPHVVSCHGDKPAVLFAVIYNHPEMHIF